MAELAETASQPPRQEELRATLFRHWGHRDFRTHQGEVVVKALQGYDVLVLMATGSGKSLCYQLPAAWAHSQPPGSFAGGRCTIVVSPLVSLMEDQVAALTSRGVPAVMLGGRQSSNCSLEADAIAGKFALVYMAPEKLVRWQHGLRAMDTRGGGILSFAVDEVLALPALPAHMHAYVGSFVSVHVSSCPPLSGALRQ